MKPAVLLSSLVLAGSGLCLPARADAQLPTREQLWSAVVDRVIGNTAEVTMPPLVPVGEAPRPGHTVSLNGAVARSPDGDLNWYFSNLGLLGFLQPDFAQSRPV